MPEFRPTYILVRSRENGGSLDDLSDIVNNHSGLEYIHRAEKEDFVLLKLKSYHDINEGIKAKDNAINLLNEKGYSAYPFDYEGMFTYMAKTSD